MTTPRRDRKRKGSPEWIRLGELLAGRRADLSPDYEGHGGRAAFARDRGVNLKLIQDIELNARENITPKTLRDVIAPAYEVTFESIRDALEGGNLEPAPEGAQAPAAAETAVPDPFEAARPPGWANSFITVELVTSVAENAMPAIKARINELRAAGIAEPDGDQVFGEDASAAVMYDSARMKGGTVEQAAWDAALTVEWRARRRGRASRRGLAGA